MNKTLTLCFVALLITFSAGAQTEKSTLLVGGNMIFQTSDGSTVFIANPNIGIFLKDKFAVGAEVYVGSASSTTIWSVGPYARLYFAGKPTGSFFGQAGIAYGGASGNPDPDIRGLAKLGYAVFMNKNVALEFVAGYNAGEGTDFLTLGVGFQIHLKK